jgi:hypothetical protein
LQRRFHAQQTLVDLPAIPTGAILILEQDDVAVGARARLTPRRAAASARGQRSPPCGGHQRHEESPEPNRLAGQVAPNEAHHRSSRRSLQ